MEHAGGSYSISLVVLSITMAIAASCISLDMTSRARQSADRRRRSFWLSASAVTMGLGIWSMHFIGMLALRLPFPTTYQLFLTFISLVIAIISSFLAVFVVSRARLSFYCFIFAGVLMGGGISLMHYIGMAAIQSTYTIHYKLLPFIGSILIAIVVSYWALYLTFRLQKPNWLEHNPTGKMTGAVLLGIAISGMHYVGMMATHFAAAPEPAEHMQSVPSGSSTFLTVTLAPDALSLWVGVTIFILIAILIAGAFIDRKLALESAQLSALQFEALYNGNPDLVCTIDLQGRIIQSNYAAGHITGYTAEELLLRTRHDLLPPERFEESERRFEKVSQGIPQTFEMELIHKNGHLVHLNATTIPVLKEKRVAAIMLIAKDITMQKQNEEMFRKSDKLSMAGQLAAGVAHEIRNPLTSIKGFFHLLRRGMGREDIYEVIDAEIDQIDSIITEFLLLANHQPEQYKRINLKELVGHVLTLLQAQANMNNIAIETRTAPDLPYILCDENKIKQVFINMIKNAIESMTGEGTITVDLTRKGDKDVLIRIADEGGGISDELRPKLGEPYYITKVKGTGIGLMVSFKIINEHNGTIEYKHADGAGTTVEVTLPID
ncbi:MHYT domain-containing protein [Paenibacillus mesophilus]|uniref:MHYT domain-containing protein n=1 Tax=Paenibacillus mesophilus TaxID=2582849 RepID=UPI001305222E|nr:MHYT domain-containing protein [Paenibacillus mesophilus]